MLELNQDPQARRLFEAREKEQRDIRAWKKDARQEGERQGIIQGERQGERNKSIEIARNLLK